uniref:Uncharacterized protein n=1 Tax=Anguilla anguilla TaxID=7936 RepID=A0A0E9SRD7_ANGAN
MEAVSDINITVGLVNCTR